MKSKKPMQFKGALLNRYPIHEILWLDASGQSGWMGLHEELDPMYCVTVGYLIGEDEHRLIMAASLNANADKGDVCYIPKRCIIRKRKIYPQKRKK